MGTVVVVQGRTYCQLVSKIKSEWGDTPIIFSTWENEPHYCYDDTDFVLYNKTPENVGTLNYNLQRVSSLNGFLKAKEMGYERVIKWRSDLIPKNYKTLLSFFKNDCINFYAFMNHQHGYVCDFFMEGDINEMINLFSDEDVNPPYPEYAFTKKMFEFGLDKKANFICKKLSTEGADIFWNKHNYWFSNNVVQTQYMDYIKK